MSEWISVKERVPKSDLLCLVWNENRPFQYYVCVYNKFFNEFEVSAIGAMIRLPDSITFNATHWMKIPAPPQLDRGELPFST